MKYDYAIFEETEEAKAVVEDERVINLSIQSVDKFSGN